MAVEERIEPVLIEEEISSSFIDYAMSVIVSRALPDVRDGLKPVHRRILFSMMEGGVLPDRPRRKSASAVGDVIRKYHPHGTDAVYDAMVRMAQDFSLRYPLIDDPDVPIKELMRKIKGPDFPTAGLIMGRDGINDAYETGRGSIKMRARVEIEEGRLGRMRLVATELPYMVNKARLAEKIAHLVQTRKISDIADLKDESSRAGICLEIA